MKFRVGHGYDVHRLVFRRPLILGGVPINYQWGLQGHSDADVLVHAIIDALLGAAGLGDIGMHFPDSDDTYKNASSIMLLAQVGAMLKEKEYRVQNIDSTVIAEAPKLAPHIGMMKEKIATALGIPQECINIKATTEEGLGFTGKKDGIAAHAACLIERGAHEDL